MGLYSEQYNLLDRDLVIFYATCFLPAPGGLRFGKNQTDVQHLNEVAIVQGARSADR